MTNNIETLKALIADASLSQVERDEAAKLLADLLQPKPTKPVKPRTEAEITSIFADAFAKIDTRYAAHVKAENSTFHVCGSCFHKQGIDIDNCKLCGASEWQPAVIPDIHTDGKRESFIAAATTYTDDQLRFYANGTVDLAFGQHCARILALRTGSAA